MGRIVLADNLAVLATLPDGSIDLIYVDPPFNTGRRRTLRRLRTVRDEEAAIGPASAGGATGRSS